MSRHTMKAVAMSGMAALLLTGCEAMNSKTGQGAVLGSAIGAGSGAIIGNQMGHHAGAGTAIGAGIGALSGGLIGHAMESNENRPTATPTPSNQPLVKFCPVGGETYTDPNMKYCPIHGAELRIKQ